MNHISAKRQSPPICNINCENKPLYLYWWFGLLPNGTALRLQLKTLVQPQRPFFYINASFFLLDRFAKENGALEDHGIQGQ